MNNFRYRSHGVKCEYKSRCLQRVHCVKLHVVLCTAQQQIKLILVWFGLVVDGSAVYYKCFA